MNWHSLERFGTEFAFWICAFAAGLAWFLRKDSKRRDGLSRQRRALEAVNQHYYQRTHSSPTYTYTRKS